MSITKAVVPVAGLGTRLLPATKSQPKEMLPIGRKPIVQYVVEELAEAGLDNILFVTGQKKRSIEDHFDFSPELGDKIIERDFPEHLSFFYIRQSNPNGLGDVHMATLTFPRLSRSHQTYLVLPVPARAQS